MEQPQIVRYGELQPCRSAFIDAHTPGSDKKKISLLLVPEWLKACINMCTLRPRPGLIQVQRVSPPSALILCIITIPQKCFSS